jgi:hypothetical protein
MKQEAIDFYAKHKIPVSKMINIGVGRKRLTAESIKLAASEVYEDISNGKVDLRPIRIAWEVYARAKYKQVEAD